MRLNLKTIASLNSLSLTVGTALLVAGLFILGVPLLELIELKTYDLRFRSRSALPPTPVVALALIDERSLDTEGRWPWPRRTIAKLVEHLSQDGARVIGFDVGFLEPDENFHLGFLRELTETIAQLGIRNDRLSGMIRAGEELADNDEVLARAIRHSSAAVVLGYFFHMSEADLDYRLQPAEIEHRLERIRPSKYPLTLYKDPQARSAPFIQAYAPESNLQILAEAAGSAGYYSVKSDPDGVVRWMPLIIQCGRHLYPPLSVVCAWHYLGRPQMIVEADRYGVQGVRMGQRLIPTDESGQLLINFLGPSKTFPYISISDILGGKTPKGTFADRIVLVGATAMGTHDLRSTPVSPLYPGVEIHATVVDSILTGDFLAKPKWSRFFDLLAILLLGAVVGIGVPRLSAVKGLAFTGALFALYVLTATWLFAHFRVWLDVVHPLLALMAVYTVLTVYRYVTEERERKRIKGVFRQYVAPLVIEEMLKDPNRMKLGGEEKVLTVLFSDLWGFTGYSERYAPHEMITFLSEYFDRMSQRVFLHWGTLKEYVGDELMAIFGAPLDQPDHALRACTTALEMRRELADLRMEWARIGRPPLRARTGINSGPMLVGNLGSRYRFAYGVLGDNVNLGSRLEGLNRAYGTEIIIGENTARLVGDAFRLRELDMVRVKGRQNAVRVYELLTKTGEALPEQVERALRPFAEGLDAFRLQNWEQALIFFNCALEANPADGAARTMLERCRVYRQTPPPREWDGVFEMLTK
ncbi:MAG: adenylate/guanylate cyclase domain-containing protein [Desulfobacterales bacterium]